jgi:GntR family transcriptional regulator of vanillate catabolism
MSQATLTEARGAGSVAVEEVVDALRRMVLDGTLEAGAKLREVELASRFQVSRTPIREALVALEREGLLVYEMNRGFSVRPFSLKDLGEAYEMRALLEGHACRVTAERGLSIDDERTLVDCIDVVDRLLASVDVLGAEELVVWQRNNALFHRTLNAPVPNQFHARMLAIVQQIPMVQHPFALTADTALMRFYSAQHRQIMRAVVFRQGARAEFLMREHIQHAYEEMRKRATAAEARAT